MKKLIAIVMLIVLLACSMTACAKKAETDAVSPMMQKVIANMPKEEDLSGVDAKVAIAENSSAQAFIAADEKLGKMEPNAKISAIQRTGARNLGYVDVPNDWSSFIKDEVFYCQDRALTGEMCFASTTVLMSSDDTKAEVLDAFTQALWQNVFAENVGINEAEGTNCVLAGYQTVMSVGWDNDGGLLAFFTFFDGSGLLHVLSVFGEGETAYMMLTYIADSYTLS